MIKGLQSQWGSRWDVKAVSSQEVPKWPLNQGYAQPAHVQIKAILFAAVNTLLLCKLSVSAGVRHLIIALTVLMKHKHSGKSFGKVIQRPSIQPLNFQEWLLQILVKTVQWHLSWLQ